MNTNKMVIMHLGFQKTGTTTIQEMLKCNSHLIPRVNLRLFGSATENLRAAGIRFCENNTHESRKGLEQAFRDHIERFLESGQDVCIISNENIIHRVAYNANGNILCWAKRILPVFEHALAGMPAYFVFYIRNEEKWKRSVYNQAVKRARVACTFDEYWSRASLSVDWNRWLEQLQGVTSVPVKFVPMENELEDGQLLGDALLELAEVSRRVRQKFRVPSVQNESLSPAALRLMRIINKFPLQDRPILFASEKIGALDRRLRRVRAG